MILAILLALIAPAYGQSETEQTPVAADYLSMDLVRRVDAIEAAVAGVTSGRSTYTAIPIYLNGITLPGGTITGPIGANSTGTIVCQELTADGTWFYVTNVSAIFGTVVGGGGGGGGCNTTGGGAGGGGSGRITDFNISITTNVVFTISTGATAGGTAANGTDASQSCFGYNIKNGSAGCEQSTTLLSSAGGVGGKLGNSGGTAGAGGSGFSGGGGGGAAASNGGAGGSCAAGSVGAGGGGAGGATTSVSPYWPTFTCAAGGTAVAQVSNNAAGGSGGGGLQRNGGATGGGGTTPSGTNPGLGGTGYGGGGGGQGCFTGGAGGAGGAGYALVCYRR